MSYEEEMTFQKLLDQLSCLSNIISVDCVDYKI